MDKKENHNKEVEINSSEKPESSKKSGSSKTPKTTVRASKYTIVGIVLTIFNFIVYTILTRTIFHNNNDILWLVSLISCTITAFLAYFLHSRITWRERNPGKTGMIKFIIWNIFIAISVSPFLTWFFGLIHPLYQLAFNISSAMHLPFDFNFVESTGVFCLTTLCTMILNYLFYDKIVFSSHPKNK